MTIYEKCDLLNAERMRLNLAGKFRIQRTLDGIFGIFYVCGESNSIARKFHEATIHGRLEDEVLYCYAMALVTLNDIPCGDKVWEQSLYLKAVPDASFKVEEE